MPLVWVVPHTVGLVSPPPPSNRLSRGLAVLLVSLFSRASPLKTQICMSA